MTLKEISLHILDSYRESYNTWAFDYKSITKVHLPFTIRLPHSVVTREAPLCMKLCRRKEVWGKKKKCKSKESWREREHDGGKRMGYLGGIVNPSKSALISPKMEHSETTFSGFFFFLGKAQSSKH